MFEPQIYTARCLQNILKYTYTMYLETNLVYLQIKQRIFFSNFDTLG